MKRIHFTHLSDANALSLVLDQALFQLANSSVQLRPSDLCRELGIPSSVLTRMRLLHVNPQYEPFVNRQSMQKIVRYLMQRFPTLVLGEYRDGTLHVRLYKKYGGQKLSSLPPEPVAVPLFKRQLPKPGSTRWFLEQLEREEGDAHRSSRRAAERI